MIVVGEGGGVCVNSRATMVNRRGSHHAGELLYHDE